MSFGQPQMISAHANANFQDVLVFTALELRKVSDVRFELISCPGVLRQSLARVGSDRIELSARGGIPEVAYFMFFSHQERNPSASRRTTTDGAAGGRFSEDRRPPSRVVHLCAPAVKRSVRAAVGDGRLRGNGALGRCARVEHAVQPLLEDSHTRLFVDRSFDGGRCNLVDRLLQ